MEEIKTKLDSMTKTCRCVIEVPYAKKSLNLYRDLDFYAIQDTLKANQYVYAMIVHDKDIGRDGVLVKKHIHLVFECPKRHRISFYINRLCEYFGVERNLVQVQVSNSFDGDIQYLVHKNNADKYQYDVKEIKTNMSYDELQDRLMRDIHKEITARYVFEVVKSCRTKTNIIEKLGLGIYNLYYKAIGDMINDGWLGYDLNVHNEV